MALDGQREVDHFVVEVFIASLVLADEHPSRVLLENGPVVGHHDDGRAFLLVDPGQQTQDSVRCLVVQIAGRLVGDDELRPVQQRARYRYSLLLTSGKLMRHLVRLVLHPHIVKHLDDPLVYLVAVFPSGCLEHELQIALDSPVHQQLEILKHNPDLASEVGNVLAFQSVEFESADLARSLLKRVLADHRADDRGLAGSDLADDVDEVSRKYVHVKPVDHGALSIHDVRVPE